MITIHEGITQGSDEWLMLRCGILTASEMKLIMTPTRKPADNDDMRAHLLELLAQRINQYVEPHYVSDDMLRGHEEEVYARMHYENRCAPVREVGFITNDEWGFTLGYSPDGLVGDDGCIECKSRRQKYQLETILSGGVPSNKRLDCSLQIQTGLLVSGRKWCDFISYHGGMPMAVYRVHADPTIHEAIIAASRAFYARMDELMEKYQSIISDPAGRFYPTERIIIQEIQV